MKCFWEVAMLRRFFSCICLIAALGTLLCSVSCSSSAGPTVTSEDKTTKAPETSDTTVTQAHTEPAPPPTAADILAALFDEGTEVRERRPVAVGKSFRMHFADFVVVDGVIRAYYIASDAQGRAVTGLAESTDGKNFTDKGIVIGCDTSYDSGYAAFAGVLYRDGVTYLAYECLGDEGGGQDIALATSTDGYHFEKQGVILDHKDCPSWCSYNIGTPDLVLADETWYLFFHGYDGTDCQIGVAYGPSLDQLTVYPDPVIPTSEDPSEPDSGTTGRRDIVYVDGWYYMVYEVSTDKVGADYSGSYWTHMFARSRDLIHWEKRAPLIRQTIPGMGYDGPNWLIRDDRVYVYFRKPGNVTYREELSFE